MEDIIEQYALVCKLNPLHNQKETKTIIPGQKINVNGYGYVDLKLPSRALWATCNVGADKPSDYGLYFQWGDTNGYTIEQVGKDKQFTWTNYKFNPSGDGDTFTKYASPNDMLELDDDAAHVHMGGDWHMPTPTQIEELIENTTSTRTKLDDVNGVMLTSKKDESKFIFIPSTGFAWYGSIFDMDGAVYNNEGDGNIWSSMTSMERINCGQYLGFDTGDSSVGSGERSVGMSIRGVIG